MLIDNMQVFCTIILQNVIISAFCSACCKKYTWLCPGRECLCRGLHAFGVGCSIYVLREVAFWVRWKWFVCYGRAFFLLLESVLLVTGERFSCYGRAFFLLREADFSVGRIDFSTSRKCFSAFAQVHLSSLTSVFMYSCRWFSVFSQVFLCILAGAFLCSYKRITFFAWAVGVYASRASPPPHPALLWHRVVMLSGAKKAV